MPDSHTTASNPLLELPCACASIRRTARLVTQLYSREIGEDLEPSQYALLSVLGRRAGATQASLGRALGMDKTTISRNLRVMRKNAWIEPAISDDLRERGFRLTAAGKKLLTGATPGWQRAQNKLRAAVGAREWDGMLQVFDRVAAAASRSVE